MPIPAGFAPHSSGYWIRSSDQSGPYAFDGTNMYPAEPLNSLNNSAGNANATVTATLAGAAGKTTFITGFEITGAGSTAGLAVNATVTGVLGGTLNYAFVAPVGVLVPAQPLIVEFNPPLAASGLNTAIVASCPALGAGNTIAAIAAHGFQV